MNSIKRIFFTLKAQLDDVADNLENHEAIADAAIKELEAYQGKTRIHQHRLQGMINQFENKIAELYKEADTWSARAVKLKEVDEQKALECVKRLQQVKQQIKTLEPQLTETKSQFNQMQTDLTAIQAQLHTLHSQKEVLSARQNRVQLQSNLKTGSSNPTAGAEAIFKRWEESVIGAELTGPIPAVKDNFADSFAQEESELELKMLLDELVTKQQSEVEN